MITVTQNVMLCGLVAKFQLTKASCCSHLQDRTVSTLKMEAIGFSESLRPIMKVYGITSQNIVSLIFTSLRTSYPILNIVQTLWKSVYHSTSYSSVQFHVFYTVLNASIYTIHVISFLKRAS